MFNAINCVQLIGKAIFGVNLFAFSLFTAEIDKTIT